MWTDIGPRPHGWRKLADTTTGTMQFILKKHIDLFTFMYLTDDKT